MRARGDSWPIVGPRRLERTARRVLVSGLCLVVALGAWGLAEAREAGLESDTGQEEAVHREDDELRTMYGRAQALIRRGSFEDAVVLLDRLIDRLDARAQDGELSEEGVLLLSRSLGYRALARLRDGDRQAADRDLDRMIELAPNLAPPERLFPEDLLERYGRRLDRVVGYLDLTVSPEDAEVAVDGTELEPGQQRINLLPGAHVVVVRRPGYFTARREVEIRAGRRQQVMVELQRASAVVRFRTRPPGAEVIVDGDVVGTTWSEGEEPATPEEEAAELSAEMVVEGLMPGQHEIELTREGYRPYRATFSVPDLTDYDLGELELQRSRARIVLRNLPAEATVYVNGEERRPRAPRPDQADVAGRAGGAPRLELSVGEYELFVSHRSGIFSRSVSLADRQTVVVDVQVRPGVVLVGIVGGDELGAQSLGEELETTLQDLEQWVYLDRRGPGERSLESHGVTGDRLTRIAGSTSSATGDPTDVQDVDWEGLQRSLESVPGSLYVVANLSEEQLASHADLWFLAAAPGPAVPQRLRVPMAADEIGELLVPRMDAALPAARPRFGALLIDTSLEDHPVILSVDPDGPAAGAGLQVGDRLVSVDDEPVRTATEARDRFSERDPGAGVVVGVEGSGGERRVVTVRLGGGPVSIGVAEPGRLQAAAWALAESLRTRRDAETPPWILRLDQALVHLGAGGAPRAIDLLRDLRGGGVAADAGAVVDYWFARAVLDAGDDATEAEMRQAREALERSAGVSGARIHYNAGPRLAPRARALLRGLGDDGGGPGDDGGDS